MLLVRMLQRVRHMGPCMMAYCHLVLMDHSTGCLWELMLHQGGNALITYCLTEASSRLSQDLAPSLEVATTPRSQHTAWRS